MVRLESRDRGREALWRTAARLLGLEEILAGDVQEVSANYDPASGGCPLFADFGRGEMRALGISECAARRSGGQASGGEPERGGGA